MVIGSALVSLFHQYGVKDARSVLDLVVSNFPRVKGIKEAKNCEIAVNPLEPRAIITVI